MSLAESVKGLQKAFVTMAKRVDSLEDSLGHRQKSYSQQRKHSKKGLKRKIHASPSNYSLRKRRLPIEREKEEAEKIEDKVEEEKAEEDVAEDKTIEIADEEEEEEKEEPGNEVAEEEKAEEDVAEDKAIEIADEKEEEEKEEPGNEGFEEEKAEENVTEDKAMEIADEEAEKEETGNEAAEEEKAEENVTEDKAMEIADEEGEKEEPGNKVAEEEKAEEVKTEEEVKTVDPFKPLIHVKSTKDKYCANPIDDVMKLALTHTIPEDKLKIVQRVCRMYTAKDDLIMSSGNVHVGRQSINEILDNKMLADEHVDIFVRMLENKIALQPAKYHKFVYISSILNHCSNLGWPISDIIKHITNDAVNEAEFIFVTVHRFQHWMLLVGRPKNKSWQLFDSFFKVEHKDVVAGVISNLHKAAGHAFNEDIRTWKFTAPRMQPQQTNGFDCGMFVCKYIERLAISKVEKVDWKNHKDWQEKMGKFRTIFAVDICSWVHKTLSQHGLIQQ